MRIVINLLTLCIFALSVGCQANPIEPLEDISSPVPPPAEGDATKMPSSLPLPDDAGLQNLIEKAKTDLSQRLAISPDQITLLEATSVVWPDASLGCPQPGMVYIQVPEDGLLIRLQVGGQIYPYHSGGFRDPFLCEAIFKDPNPPPKIDFFNLTPSNPDTATTPENSIPPGEDQ
jgi:hypothetical protein